MSFGEHLEDLRRRLIHALAGIVAAALVTFYFGFHIMAWLARPFLEALAALGLPPQVYVRDPTLGFRLYLKVSLISAVIVASPWVVYQLWRFIASGLYAHEKRVAYMLAPFSAVMTVLAILLVATYFVTSSDSASLVIDMLTSGGATDTPKIQRVFWAVLEGGIAAVLLLAGAGGLAALQAAAIATALPFSLVMIVMCYGLVRALYADDHRYRLDDVILAQRGHKRVPECADPKRSPFKDGVQGSP